MNNGFFLMIDGLDGSGKGTALDALKQWAIEKKKKVLDLREYWKQHGKHPEKEIIDEYEVIISAEPTYVNHGKKIREEMISNQGKQYSPKDIAQAFSKDREELYNHVIVPALKKGKWVFQERGVITSLVYQPLQELDLEEIKSLPGNKLTLQYAPTLMIITKINPEVTMQRLAKRAKQDDAIFENLEFQRKVADIYASTWLKELFEKYGSKVIYIDTNPPSKTQDTRKKIREIIEKHIK